MVGIRTREAQAALLAFLKCAPSGARTVIIPNLLEPFHLDLESSLLREASVPATPTCFAALSTETSSLTPIGRTALLSIFAKLLVAETEEETLLKLLVRLRDDFPGDPELRLLDPLLALTGVSLPDKTKQAVGTVLLKYMTLGDADLRDRIIRALGATAGFWIQDLAHLSKQWGAEVLDPVLRHVVDQAVTSSDLNLMTLIIVGLPDGWKVLANRGCADREPLIKDLLVEAALQGSLKSPDPSLAESSDPLLRLAAAAAAGEESEPGRQVCVAGPPPRRRAKGRRITKKGKEQKQYSWGFPMLHPNMAHVDF
eukprot:Protomagalhaensia_sp_Gyna_25__5822@NODE_861_length_2501_cov_14_361495_g680_i0_p2_GENE_NODE_861_length_2501_cov_14_361495_g680_i0NODE_861_length_2501_cov_14_361495_g680_i0_p2_ORF_typecomplete_len312_score41_90GRIP/PF01465_20/5_3e03GRIP/PF01465_20/0_77GRIP/PF01465_20/9_7e03HEAT_2/PF13646_6/8_9e03HEAT_2/PF13646_6/7_9e03HEAT_2/PF13646_6/34HEAT_2/PF13646_6/20_NODE_861_length_2501_cov_14_361495_g680_i013102245